MPIFREESLACEREIDRISREDENAEVRASALTWLEAYEIG